MSENIISFSDYQKPVAITPCIESAAPFLERAMELMRKIDDALDESDGSATSEDVFELFKVSLKAGAEACSEGYKMAQALNAQPGD